jgi:predicted nucleic acid-binding protein
LETSIVLDASAVINLNATGRAAEILVALGSRFVVSDEVIAELAQSAKNGRRDGVMLATLIVSGLVQRASLGETALDAFENLVVGGAAETLDDGEAATIALALELNGCAVIDECKGRKICGVRYPSLTLMSSIQIICNQRVEASIGSGGLKDAVFAALTGARMHVLPEYLPSVAALFEPDQLALCFSLPKAVRRQPNDAG